MSYFEVEAISNSLLNRVAVFLKYNIPSERWREDINIAPSEAMEIGTLVDELLSGELVQSQIFCCDEHLAGFTPKEKEVILKGITMSIYDAYVDTYNNAETRSNKAVDYNNITKKADELFLRARPYYDALENNSGKRQVSNEVYNTVMSCYNALTSNLQYNELFGEVDMSEIGGNIQNYKQLEIYWQYPMNDYTANCKSKIDLLKVNYTDKIVRIGDLKTHSQRLDKTIKNKNYIRQLSFYSHSVEYWLREQGYNPLDFKFEYYIVGVDTSYYSVTIIPISSSAILDAKNGGYYKPEWMTQYNFHKDFQPYLSDNQIKSMIYNEFWNLNYETEFRIYGWKELIEYYQQICYNTNHFIYHPKDSSIIYHEL